ncbi:MAG: HNH endonuclease [Puniceicoccaceae bacterium]
MNIEGGSLEDGASRKVLVLNRVWQPVNIVGIKRAITFICQDHAQVIDTRDGSYRIVSGTDWIMESYESPPGPDELCVRSVKMRLRVPSVLLLRQFDRVPVQEMKLNRKAIFERDGYRCQYCGECHEDRFLNLDHVIPRDQGGRTTWENIVTSCLTCNSKKANRLPHQAGFTLRKSPQRPKHRPFLSVLRAGESDSAWAPFIGKEA